jgi:hypothetical protein
LTASLAAQTFLPPATPPTNFWNATPVVHLSPDGAPDIPPQVRTLRMNGVAWYAVEASRGVDTNGDDYSWTGIDHYTAATESLLYTFLEAPTWASAQTDPITAFSVSSNVVTIDAANTLIIGNIVKISGLSTGTYLNGRSLTVTFATPTQFTASFSHASVPLTDDSGSVAFAGTKYQAPRDLYVTAPCQGVLTGTTTTDCQYKEFVTALMQHVCPSRVTCKIKNFEAWNEFSSNGYWDDTWQHLATMSEDAARIIKAYCVDCKFGAGSVSASGVGWNDSEHNTRNSAHPNWTYYDEALEVFLTAWKNDRAADHSIAAPDFISWHAYSAYADVSNSPGGALTPQPMPEYSYSGDGSGKGGDEGSSSCSIANESATTNKYCNESIVTQAATVAALTKDNTYGVWLKPYWVTEGSYLAQASMENSDNNDASATDPKAICTGPYDPVCTADVIRSAYLARWLILLRAAGVSQAYWYSWDEPCFGTLFGMDNAHDGKPSTCPGTVDPSVKYNPGGATFYNLYNTRTRAGNTWYEIQAWLNWASRPMNCAENATTHIYSCTITRLDPLGYEGLIVWYTPWLQTTSYTPPSGFTQYRTVDNPTPVAYTTGPITLGAEPVLFERKASWRFPQSLLDWPHFFDK